MAIRVCQWCKIVMGYTPDHKHGDLRESHGACDSCISIHEPVIYQKMMALRKMMAFRARLESEHA